MRLSTRVSIYGAVIGLIGEFAESKEVMIGGFIIIAVSFICRSIEDLKS